jgi:tetratricopeptide (TPR) repeat protein
VLVSLVALVVYANTLGNGLVYDDKNILLSPLLGTPWNIAAVFDNRFYPNLGNDIELYRPLTNFGYLVNHWFNEVVTGSGANAAGFHVVGVLMHMCAACLFYAWLVSLELERKVALSAALVFAVLPIHTEAVASVFNRSEAQATIFGLAFLLLHRRGAWPLAMVAYLCAAWSKESAVAFLPVAIAADLYRSRASAGGPGDRPRTNWNHYAGYVGVALLWFVLRADALRGVEPSTLVIENPLRAASFVERALTAGRVQFEYLRLLLVPLELSTDYSLRQIPIVTSALDPGFIAFAAVLAGATALAWFARKRQAIVTFAIVAYACLFSVTSNFLLPTGTIMGERLAYAPSMLVCLLIASTIWTARYWIGERFVVAAIAGLLAVYATKSIAQNRVWHDELTLFAEQVRTAPDSAKSHINYGCALDVDALDLESRAASAGRGGRTAEQQTLQLAAIERHREALAQYEASIAIYDQYAQAHYLSANARHALQEPPDEIIAAYRRAIRVDPSHVDARVNLAVTLIECKRLDEARQVVLEIAALDPGHPSLPGLQRQLAQAGTSRK